MIETSTLNAVDREEENHMHVCKITEQVKAKSCIHSHTILYKNTLNCMKSAVYYLKLFKRCTECSFWGESRFICGFLICQTSMCINHWLVAVLYIRFFSHKHFHLLLTCIIRWHLETTSISTTQSKASPFLPALEPWRVVVIVVLYL